MKTKKFLTYLLSGLVPLIIFFILSTINNYLPLGKNMINVYDSFSQYSSILLEYKNLLLNGNIFYSWNAGLGFNFFGTLTYYCMSPLNLLALFADTVNYPYFISYMTLLRVFLLGIAMCFYLNKRNTKDIYTILFSTIYALMGYTSSYYYNFLWIDSIIALPFVIHGLDRLIENNEPKFYIVSLSISIILNYYIGYMICIFSLIYFIYRIVLIKNKKEIIKTFIISSILTGFMCSFVIIPSFFALLTGKSHLYSSVDYSGISTNAYNFFYTLTSGSFQRGDQTFGPAQIYSSIFVLILNIYFFFNKNISKKEKIVTGIVLLFFYLSFSINALNYAWQFFQKPIWWNSRFSFTFSFFMILIAVKSLENIQYVKINIKSKLIVSIVFIALFLVGAYFKKRYVPLWNISNYIFLAFSILIFLEEIFLADNKYFFPLIVFITLIDVTINTYNNLKQNNRGENILYYTYLREFLPEEINKLNKENDNYFYRFEMIDDYTSDDGLYFNYHGINYFNSVRNISTINLLKRLGLYVTDMCHVDMNALDPVFLSIFNVKYLYGKVDYYDYIDNSVSVNPYPLSLGFGVNKEIKNLTLKDDYKENLNNIISSMLGYDINLYKRIYSDKFTLIDGSENEHYYSSKNGKSHIKYKFKSDARYIIIPNENDAHISVNGDPKNSHSLVLVHKNDEVEIQYTIYKKTNKNKIYFDLIDVLKYEVSMKELSKDLMKAKIYVGNSALTAEMDVSEDEYLFTSIEYEEGMRIYVDGKEIKPDIILDALIGFDISKGHHVMTINYIPKGLKVGVCASLLSLNTCVIYLQIRKKNL